MCPEEIEQFFENALAASRLSLDPSSQVGAAFWTGAGWAWGWNELCPGSPAAWYQDREQKYPHIVHAEERLLLRFGALARGETVAITHFPCRPCAKLLAAARVGRVIAIYQHDYETRWADSVAEARAILERAGIGHQTYERK